MLLKDHRAKRAIAGRATAPSANAVPDPGNPPAVADAAGETEPPGDDAADRPAIGTGAGACPRLNPLEAEVIDLFVQLSRLLGQPRSLGEIYGLLFISAQPLVMDELIARLHLSKGSASQGLRYLQTLGAVRSVYVPGDRRMHYAAVAELRVLVSRFLSEQVLPHLDSGLRRLDTISSMAKDLPAGDQKIALERIQVLQTWERKGRRVLPFVTKMLSVGK